MARRATGKAVRPAAKRRITARQRALKKHGQGRIDEFLREIGVKDPSEWIDDEGMRHFEYGDAEGVAFVDYANGDVLLNVIAIIMNLPSDRELIVPLMRDLLEANNVISGAARFAIAGDSVVVSATDAVESMADGDYGRHITGVMSLADRVMAALRRNTGGTTRKRPR